MAGNVGKSEECLVLVHRLAISVSTTYVFDTSGSFPRGEWLDIAEKACS